MRFLRLIVAPALLAACGLAAAGCEGSKTSTPVTIPTDQKIEIGRPPTPPPLPNAPRK